MARPSVLVACEFSGIVRDAFTAVGWDALSCDLQPSERPGPHYLGDVRDLLAAGEHFDLMVAFPPCQHLASAGARWFKDKQVEQAEALDFVRMLLDAPIERIALENPVGMIGTYIRKPDQVVQPWWFGEDAAKRTCLWLKNLPPLEPTDIIIRRRYANQTNAGQDKRGPSKARVSDRSRTYPGIAAAMAQQWGQI